VLQIVHASRAYIPLWPLGTYRVTVGPEAECDGPERDGLTVPPGRTSPVASTLKWPPPSQDRLQKASTSVRICLHCSTPWKSYSRQFCSDWGDSKFWLGGRQSSITKGGYVRVGDYTLGIWSERRIITSSQRGILWLVQIRQKVCRSTDWVCGR